MTTFAAINLKELRQHETFASVGEMDKSIYEYIDYIRHDVPQSVIDVLLCLGKASLRCIGISFMKQATIAKDTGYSRKTINKAIKTLETLGVVDSKQTKTKAGRPSVKVMRILPFHLKRLQQGVTSYEGDKANGGNVLTLIDEFEPFVQESLKQENNNIRESQSIIEKVSKLSTNMDIDGNLKNVVRYLALKVGNKVKEGLRIESFGAYCEKVFANEVRRFAVMQSIAEEKHQKEDAEKNRFDNFVMRYFGDRFEVIGSFAQQEARRMYQETTQSKRPNPVFYNWLES
ncbi:helix-turn-helix domain-containing protein [Sporosarcina sp. FSL K6-6792]|uniref:helix-turn-helix domain-containing protein n=1 Tax=Sporosarcina sp. FSL K6-6792 TaxID=2921559 RepID=UPI0030F54578